MLNPFRVDLVAAKLVHLDQRELITGVARILRIVRVPSQVATVLASVPRARRTITLSEIC